MYSFVVKGNVILLVSFNVLFGLCIIIGIWFNYVFIVIGIEINFFVEKIMLGFVFLIKL